MAKVAKAYDAPLPSKQKLYEEENSNEEVEDAECEASTRFSDAKLMVVQSMIKQIRNGTPIYRLQLPIFLLEPRSLLERYSDFCMHVDYILRIPSLPDPLERFLGVVKFYLSGWHTRPNDIRNPFNPVIGEIFRCRYDHGDSVTQYIAEQISHHPPSTAFCIINEAKGMTLNAYIRPVTHFRGNSLDISLEGKLVGHINKYEEDYEVGFPHILVRGVLIGTLQITLAGPARLSCPQSGYYAEFDFKTKGMLRGKHNYVVAQIKHTSQKKPICTIEGRWDGQMSMTRCKTDQKEMFLDVHTAPVCQSTVPPLDAQAENESRRVWRHVIENILANNEEVAQLEKTKVEEHQRALDRDRKKDSIAWVPRLFTEVHEDYYVHNSLAAQGKAGN